MSSTREEEAVFVEEHRELVDKLARKVRAQFDLNMEHEELLQLGFHGLLEARARFDASRGVRFSTFAYYRVRGAMIDGVRKMGYVSRRAHEHIRRAEAVDNITEEAASTRGASGQRDAASAAELLNKTLTKLTASYTIAALGQDETEKQDSPENQLLRSESKARVRVALNELPERELALIRGFYFEGRRFDEVAKELGISKSWASRLHSKALERLRDALVRR